MKFVLGLINNKDGNRIGIRTIALTTKQVTDETLPDNANYINLQINGGVLIPKHGLLSDFPVLTYDSSLQACLPGVQGAGAWALKQFDDGRLLLMSVGGQMKVVTNETALQFHKQYKIVGCEIGSDGRLVITHTYKVMADLDKTDLGIAYKHQKAQVNEEPIQVDMAELIKEFNRVYTVLYNNQDKVSGYQEALSEGDKFIQEHPNFVGQFVRHRGDFLSSDREVAAFMIALRNLRMTQGERLVQESIDSVIIPEDPREARIQAAGAIQALTGMPLAGLTFCVTGKVNYGTRNEFYSFIESKGGKVASSVTKGVDYLITNTPFSGSTKNRAARANGCHVISEAEFMKMVRTGERPKDYNVEEKPKAPYEKYVSGSVKGKTFCITGRVEFPGKRAALQQYIRKLGGYVADSVDYAVDYLITNDPFSGSRKNRDAQRYGCKVISEEQFLIMAGYYN